MFQDLRKRIHLTPSMFVAFIALVLALTGGAFAATGGSGGGRASDRLTASVAKKKTKVPAGKPGPRGPAGPKGATGATGAAGATGATGAQGSAGPAGPAGVKGAAGLAGPKGNEGPEGNEGKEGPEGSPWTDGGTLPSGSTETGTWKIELRPPYDTEEPTAYGHAVVSFPIPLSKEAAGKMKAHYITLEAQTMSPRTGPALTECAGTAAAPTAEAGTLCVYEAYAQELGGAGSELTGTEAPLEEITFPPIPEGEGLGVLGTTGALVGFHFRERTVEIENSKQEKETVRVGAETYGTWAVTAPAAP
jgi:hypothetical protein